MGVEVRPFGVRCNIGCHYCYQNPEREAGNVLLRYDVAKMIEGIDRLGREFSLFGGEPLLMPIGDLKKLWAHGLSRYGKNGIQTNGILITDEHLRLFSEFKVAVGISIDGPDECNDLRWAGTLEKTRRGTARTLDSIENLCKAGQPPGLIVTLHRQNALEPALSKMKNWVRSLDESGIRHVRLHLLEAENASIRSRYSLTEDQAVTALLGFYELERELKHLRFDLFKEMRRLLVGDDKKVTCVWTGCDPYTTEAVQGIEGNGQRSNCGRTNKEGIDFVKSDAVGFERYLALHSTPQNEGGCSGCRFFIMCKGHCPGTAIEGDWRNRTEHCEVLKRVFEYFEAELLAQGVVPLSKNVELREQVEEAFLAHWERGKSTSMRSILGSIKENSVGNCRKE
jgi:radical SAM protein with 4Fe4S-binding SPASM domain